MTAFARISISQDGTWAGEGTLTDGTIECTAVLGPDGLDHASGEQQEAAEAAYEAIEDAIRQGRNSVTVAGIEYTWTIREPVISVLGLGDDDWTDEGGDSDWERYGTVRVQIDDVTYEVGACIGVPAYLRGTAVAAGGDRITPYLDAWYVTRSDWSDAPTLRPTDRSGVPQNLADDVLAAIAGAARRLWDEAHAEA